MMNWTRAAHLIPGGLAGDESEQIEDIGQRDPGSGFGEVNARHGSVLKESDVCSHTNWSTRRYRMIRGTEKRNP